jgi:hypothetical protein
MGNTNTGTENSSPPRADASCWPSREELAAAEARLREDPRFQSAVAVFANYTVVRSLTPNDRTEPVPPEVAQQALEFAGRLMCLASTPTASPKELELARALVDLAWMKTPLLTKDGDSFVAKYARNAAPWQIPLTRIFEMGACVGWVARNEDGAIPPRQETELPDRAGRGSLGTVVGDPERTAPS